MKLTVCLLVSLINVLGGIKAYSQHYWELNHWDQKPLAYHGNTLKKKYIITTPGLMGPNALPVPETRKGLVENDLYLKVGADAHLGNGDHTQNAYAKFYYPVAPGKVAIELYGVPYEQFTLSDKLKEKRRIVDSTNSGHTIGDLYFGTVFQLIKNKKVLPDMALALTCKTASGNNLLHARFTDAPAYFFDISMGKNISLKSDALKQTRIYGSGGFYAWQTNSDIQRQDDAFLYGIGAETTYHNWLVNQSFAGYIGYIGLRDKPSVYRLQLTRQFTKFNYGFEYQAGTNDFDYHTFRFSVSYLPLRKKNSELTGSL